MELEGEKSEAKSDVDHGWGEDAVVDYSTQQQRREDVDCVDGGSVEEQQDGDRRTNIEGPSSSFPDRNDIYDDYNHDDDDDDHDDDRTAPSTVVPREMEEEEVTLEDSPLDRHLKRMGIDEKSLDPSSFSSSPNEGVDGKSDVGDEASKSTPKRKIGSGEIVWRDGAFIDDDEDDEDEEEERFGFAASTTTTTMSSSWRRLFRWVPRRFVEGAFDSLKRKLRRIWRGSTRTHRWPNSSTSPSRQSGWVSSAAPPRGDWLRVCVNFFGFSEQLKTYMRYFLLGASYSYTLLPLLCSSSSSSSFGSSLSSSSLSFLLLPFQSSFFLSSSTEQ